MKSPRYGTVVSSLLPLRRLRPHPRYFNVPGLVFPFSNVAMMGEAITATFPKSISKLFGVPTAVRRRTLSQTVSVSGWFPEPVQ
jgi:hypothetical protein